MNIQIVANAGSLAPPTEESLKRNASSFLNILDRHGMVDFTVSRNSGLLDSLVVSLLNCQSRI